MRFARSAFAALALALAALPAWASPSEIARALPSAEKVGEARYQVMAVPIFNAELWAPNGDFSWQAPFALSLTYERSARATTQLNRSISEMMRRGAGTPQTLAPLRRQLETCVPNVTRGDRLTAVSTGANTARFFHNGAERCHVNWPGFRRHFFGIWLDGRDGRAAMLSARLRGEA